MNARPIVVITLALCLTGATAFSQSQNGLTVSPAPRAWSDATPQPPVAATAPRPTRQTPAAVAAVEGDTQAPAQAATPTPAGVPGGQAGPVMPRFAAPQKGQLLNVKVEFTITDQIGTKPPVKKTMTMMVADRESSRIRTSADYYVKLTRETKQGAAESYLDRRSAPLSVDVNPTVEGNKIRLDFSIEYTVDGDAGEGVPPSKTNVSERLAAVLDSGVPMVVAQSSDAVSDRKVTIEIKATIVK
jgi:hypothetical protein